MKRFFDFVSAAVAIVLLSPVMLTVAALVAWRLGRPVLFRQTRPGLRGQPFRMVKFRTMANAADRQGASLSDAERMTPLGRVLRGTSLDELPELWNVLKGDMSLVGPRPLLMDYLPLYTPEQAIRHEVRPGLTGWTQVRGRNALSWEEKFACDTWYVRNRGFGLDLWIIVLTVVHLLRPQGIAAAGEATMPRFTGVRPRSTGDKREADARHRIS